MVNKKNIICQMILMCDYVLIYELITLNIWSSLFIHPLLTRQEVIPKLAHEFLIYESFLSPLTLHVENCLPNYVPACIDVFSSL